MALRGAVGLEASIRRASRRRLSRPPELVWRRRLGALVAGLAIVLGAARAALPWAARAAAERALSGEGWRARIKNVHVSLWRGAWRLDGLTVSSPGTPPGVELRAASVQIALSAPRPARARPRSRVTVEGASLYVRQPAALPPLFERLSRLTRGEGVRWSATGGAVWRLPDDGELAFAELLAQGSAFSRAGGGEAALWAASGPASAAVRLEFSRDDALAAAAGHGLFGRAAPADFSARVTARAAQTTGVLRARRGDVPFADQPFAAPPGVQQPAALAVVALAQGLDAAWRLPAPPPAKRRPRRAVRAPTGAPRARRR